ncbi:MAG: hypothetical protein SWH61_03550 [Thermodesulfobacteriota bacterium]|nr:hypothetical protein [Thermodesulfobacteriota bacterium]
MFKLKNFLRGILLVIVCMGGLITIMGKGSIPSGVTSQNLTIESAAAAWAWVYQSPTGSWGTNGSYRWNTRPNPNAGTAGAGSQILPCSYVPQPGFPIPSGTHGITFDMLLEVPSSASLWKNGMFTCIYVLEYELPRAETGGNYSWETDLSITLPRGIMYRPDNSEPEGYASFIVFAIEDPENTMSIGASNPAGRPILSQKILERLGELPQNNTNGLIIESDTTQNERWSRNFNGNFGVSPGVTPRLFFVVSSQFFLNDGGEICVDNCYKTPRPSMAQMAQFSVDTTDGPGVKLVTLNNAP